MAQVMLPIRFYRCSSRVEHGYNIVKGHQSSGPLLRKQPMTNTTLGDPQEHLSALRIYTFGGLSILLSGEQVKGFASKKSEALLVYLACKRQAQPRELLADLLWDERSQERAMSNLRVVLSSLRQSLAPYLAISRQKIGINLEEALWTDVTELEDHLASAYKIGAQPPTPAAIAHLEKAAGLYRGRFLEGFYLRDCARFENWMIQEQERLHRLALESLLALAAYFSGIGEYNQGLHYAHRSLELDPLTEQAHQHLMRLLALSGQREAALKQYEICRQILLDELDLEPTAGTQILYQKILAGELADVQTPPTVPAALHRAETEQPSTPGRGTAQIQAQGNLPEPLTSFVGRVRQIAEIRALLAQGDYRLVTLTGPGGVGKTRLALQVARELIASFPDGVFFVDLAPLSEAKLVASRLAQVLGVKDTNARPVTEAIKAELQAKKCLLVLDNFEQVIEAASLVSELLSAAARLCVLATSREALRVYGEQEYPVPPLALPDPQVDESRQALDPCESVALFIQRARAANPSFQLTDENSRQVAGICLHLDGLPLAIELAAARIRLYTPKYLLSTLTDSLGALIGGPRDFAARHRTLRAAIDWSYRLLEPPEKQLFATLAVFQGGGRLEDIAAVCNPGGVIDLLETLESLVNKNLLQPLAGPQGEPRFTFLETIRHYARQRFQESGDEGKIRKRHAERFTEIARRAEPELRGPAQETWSAMLRSEYDNLRAALAWSLGGAAVQTGLVLAGALAEFWYYEGPLAEGEKWIGQALGWVEQAPPAARARLLNGASMLAFARGDHASGKAWNRKALAIAREYQDKPNWAWALFWLSAHATAYPQEYQEGLALCEQALALFREIDDKSGLAWSYNQVGEFSRLVKDYPRARQAYEDSLLVCRESGNRRREAIALLNLSYVAQHQGDCDQAEAYILAGLRLMQELKLEYHTAIALSMAAGPFAAGGDARRAARLLGASQAIFRRKSIDLQPADRVEIEGYIAAVRGQLDPQTFEVEWARGLVMTTEQALAEALSGAE
jgi:predicted ATPase/DNA-binding SARP family transcriptional activator